MNTVNRLLVFCVLYGMSTTFAPSFGQNQNSDADNTAQNRADRNRESETAQGQSNSKSDLETTSKLRRAIMDTKGLSVNAQNIKIITQDGRVILRGPVDNAKEKELIDRLARKHCGANCYRNELEIKTK